MPTELTGVWFDEAGGIEERQWAYLSSQTGRANLTTFEPKEETMEETTAPPQAEPSDPAGAPPRALSNHVNHRHFHPSYMRVGVRIDGVERSDLKWYDMDAGQAITVNGTMIRSDTIEPFWRYAESRQMRRARERWEGKRK